MLFLPRYRTAAFAMILASSYFSISLVAQPKSTSHRAAPGLGKASLGPVKRIDIVGLRKALTPSKKPLLVNFWATWCDPCREEFPDLVKLDSEYKDRIDFITISLDELSEIDRDVPKFLVEMKAGMPAYLLKAQDDDAAIAFVSKDWSGALPLTILYSANGKQIYYRQGKVKIDTVRAEIEKLLVPAY